MILLGIRVRLTSEVIGRIIPVRYYPRVAIVRDCVDLFPFGNISLRSFIRMHAGDKKNCRTAFQKNSAS
jgi:hypothetical protein